MSLFFESEGCRLTALDTAEKGLEALKSEKYGIIMVDYRLPGMDGIEFLKRIDRNHPDTINILITAYGSPKVLSEAAELRIHEVIDKPFTSETIMGTLYRLIDYVHKKNNIDD